MALIYARETLPKNNGKSIFLMGPTPRSVEVKSWRPAVIELLDSFDGDIFIPEDRPDPDGKTRFRGEYIDQVEWEEAALVQATVILVYVPRNMATMPALTTNVEWGVWQDSGKIVLGLPVDAVGNRYLEHYAHKLGVPLSDNMGDTVQSALRLMAKLTSLDPKCVFCKIVSGAIPTIPEWQSSDSIVITPLGPVVTGHRLVIPRVHVRNAVENPRITGKVMRDAAAYAREVGDCNILTSVGKDATQTVFHLHVHVVPRVPSDGLTLPWTGQKHGRLMFRGDAPIT